MVGRRRVSVMIIVSIGTAQESSSSFECRTFFCATAGGEPTNGTRKNPAWKLGRWTDPDGRGMREAHSVWARQHHAPLLAGLVVVVKQRRTQTTADHGTSSKPIGTDTPPRLTEARHDGTEEREQIKSTNTIARARTRAKFAFATNCNLFVLCT